ncbi:hypothetical protein Lal_00010383 [Lupinus albus]|nr:hypothetical protein Lal_00010383 [Lupinus albus]
MTVIRSRYLPVASRADAVKLIGCPEPSDPFPIVTGNTMTVIASELSAAIRSIPDYPKPGIIFRDITTLLGNPRAFRRAVDELVQPYAGTKIDKIAGMEARGFILGGAVAHQLSAGFVPIRKKGKLPHTTVRVAYSLEYGVDEMEMHVDAVQPGEKVILVDDLIATGGTAEGAVKLLRQMGADIVYACFVIDLPDLGGRKKLEDLGVESGKRSEACPGQSAAAILPRWVYSNSRTPLWKVITRAGIEQGDEIGHIITGKHRLLPFELSKPRRGAEPRWLNALLFQPFDLFCPMGQETLHPARARVPARGAEAAENAVPGGFGIKMEGLRIKIAGEANDVFGGKMQRVEGDALADRG